MLTIGEFSRTCFVTKKTLRHYDDIGLLRPAHVAENGYRYYTVDQFRTMRLISRLKSYGLSLPEIAAYLANPDDELLSQKLEEKKRVMQSELQSAERTLTLLEQDIEKLKRSEDIMKQDITVKTVERKPETIFGVRKTIAVKDFQELFGELFSILGRKGIQPLGAPMAFYHDEKFDSEDMDIEVAVPVAEGVDGSRKLEGGLHACSTLLGPYDPDAFTATYAGLVKWIEDNGYRIARSPFDVYAKGGPGENPEDNITEIYFPLEK